MMSDFELTEEQFRINVGERIAKYRRNSQKTQENLAELADLHKNTLQNIERGESVPELWTFYKICQALNVDIGEFFKEI